MKKMVFPKNCTDITAYLLPDGIGFAVTLRVKVGNDTTHIHTRACLRTTRNMLGESSVPWYLHCSLDGRYGCLEPNELLKITEVRYYKEAYDGESSYNKLLGSRGEMMCLTFEKGYSLQGVNFGEFRDVGQLTKTAGPCAGCDAFLSAEKTTLFDVKLEDLRGAK